MTVSSKVIRVPVRHVDGQWEVLYGGPVRVGDGAIGELHLDKSFFTDKSFLRALTQKRNVQVLPEGTELRLALSIRAPLSGLERFLVARKETPHTPSAKVGQATFFVPVWLAGPTQQQRNKGILHGGLVLQLEGMEPRAIESGQIQFPDIPSLGQADSLNHAFTRLSELFEPWRKAHTGSIYERVFYRESDGLWYPLDTLRDRSLVQAEREVISALWERVSHSLGTALL